MCSALHMSCFVSERNNAIKGNIMNDDHVQAAIAYIENRSAYGMSRHFPRSVIKTTVIQLYLSAVVDEDTKFFQEYGSKLGQKILRECITCAYESHKCRDFIDLLLTWTDLVKVDIYRYTQFGDVDFIKRCVDAKINAGIQPQYRNSKALRQVVELGHVDMVSYLLELSSTITPLRIGSTPYTSFTIKSLMALSVKRGDPSTLAVLTQYFDSIGGLGQFPEGQIHRRGASKSASIAANVGKSGPFTQVLEGSDEDVVAATGIFRETISDLMGNKMYDTSSHTNCVRMILKYLSYTDIEHIMGFISLTSSNRPYQRNEGLRDLLVQDLLAKVPASLFDETQERISRQFDCKQLSAETESPTAKSELPLGYEWAHGVGHLYQRPIHHGLVTWRCCY